MTDPPVILTYGSTGDSRQGVGGAEAPGPTQSDAGDYRFESDVESFRAEDRRGNSPSLATPSRMR